MISNASSTIDINVVSPITSLQVLVVSDATERVIGRPIRLKHIGYGTDINVTWSFGDNSPTVVTQGEEIKHNFSRYYFYHKFLDNFG